MVMSLEESMYHYLALFSSFVFAAVLIKLTDFAESEVVDASSSESCDVKQS
jgi:hypothetical protein